MSTQRKSNSSSRTWLHTGHAFTNRFHHAPSFMPKNTWKEALRVSPTESVCISVAHSCCYNLKTTKSFQIRWPTIFTIGPHKLASSNTPHNGDLRQFLRLQRAYLHSDLAQLGRSDGHVFYRERFASLPSDCSLADYILDTHNNYFNSNFTSHAPLAYLSYCSSHIPTNSSL